MHNSTLQVGAQAFRSGSNLAAPRDGIPTNDNDDATDTIPDTEDAATPGNRPIFTQMYTHPA